MPLPRAISRFALLNEILAQYSAAHGPPSVAGLGRTSSEHYPSLGSRPTPGSGCASKWSGRAESLGNRDHGIGQRHALRRTDWVTDATELNLMINTAALMVDRRGADFVNIGTFCFAFHAIGRYFQRQPDRGDAALHRDLALFSRITVPTEAPEQNVNIQLKAVPGWAG